MQESVKNERHSAGSLVFKRRTPRVLVEHEDFWASRPLKWVSGDKAKEAACLAVTPECPDAF